MSVNPGETVKFIRQKDYVIEKVVGQGGTGLAVLIRDETLDMQFLCKSYNPQGGNDVDECFQRFIEEIRILYLLAHENVVRIYNYYLYPAQKTGYILMEYIDGQTLDAYFEKSPFFDYNDVFFQIINGFAYLEKNNVLHRDIKPNNILIDKHSRVKIIDFGFGKHIDKEEISSMSVRLNWQASKSPNELDEGKYDHKTEMFFIGKMYEGLLGKTPLADFRYQDIIDKMSDVNPEMRPATFSKILEMMTNSILNLTDFSSEDKEIYCSFADSLVSIIGKFTASPIFEEKGETIIKSIEGIISNCGIEVLLQDNRILLECFISTRNFTCYPHKRVYIDTIKKFYLLFKRLPNNKRDVVIRSILSRLKTVKVEIKDDLPFDL